MTQNEKILSHLAKGKQLTVNEATTRFKIQNLSARISELRDNGFEISTDTVTKSRRPVTVYTLSTTDQRYVKNELGL